MLSNYVILLIEMDAIELKLWVVGAMLNAAIVLLGRCVDEIVLLSFVMIELVGICCVVNRLYNQATAYAMSKNYWSFWSF